MRRAAVVAAVACCVLAARGAAAEDPNKSPDRPAGVQVAPDGTIQRTAEFTSAVAKAIDRGVEYLRTQQKADGSFGSHPGYPCGLTAIAYHTLRTCGVAESDPACTRAYESLRREYAAAKTAGELRTYSAGLTMLAVADHALSFTPDRTKGKAAPKRLVDERDRTWMNDLVAYFENCQAANGAWRYGDQQQYGRGDARRTDYDHSNTQYAAQGLRAAALLGCEVKTETWRALADHLVGAQESDGPAVTLTPPLRKGQTGAVIHAKARGWGYYDVAEVLTDKARARGRRREEVYGSMTAGSIASLVIARNELRGRQLKDAGLPARADASVRDGIAWLARNFDVTRNPGYGGWHLYYLYALERAGDLADVEWMGDHDWYGEGAAQILSMQDERGAWREGGPEVVATSFALLFLRRAARVMENRTPGGGEETIRFDLASTLAAQDFEDLVDLVVSRWRRATTASSRDALATGAASVGPRIVYPLLVRMESPDAEKRRAAHEVLRRATGLTLPFDPDGDAAARAESLRAFEAWTIETAGRLRFDPARGLLVVE